MIIYQLFYPLKLLDQKFKSEQLIQLILLMNFVIISFIIDNQQNNGEYSLSQHSYVSLRQFSIKHEVKNISKVQYQSAGNILLVLHDGFISFFTYHTKNNYFEKTGTKGPIEELQNTQILLLEWLVDQECVVCVGSDGSIFTIGREGDVDVKAQNEDGIAAASISPTQQYYYVVTNNKSLIQLNKQFDLVNEIPLDQNQEVVVSNPSFSWRADGSYFVINYETINGRKAVTKHIMMGTFISPAKSDPKEDGVVQSVSQKGQKKLTSLVSWQPSGSIIAGVDSQIKGQDRFYRVIFWEKNGLRHLQFSLKSDVKEVVNIFWSLDSSILFVRVINKKNQQKLLLYYRANYHWFLKNEVSLQLTDFCQSLSCEKHKKHKLLITGQQNFQIIEYSITHSEKQWKTYEDEQQSKNQFQYFIDGNILHATDYSRCLIPPPMSMVKHQFESNILGFSKLKNNILTVTEGKIHLLDLVKNERNVRDINEQLKNKRIYGVELINISPLQFAANSYIFQLSEDKIIKKEKSNSRESAYNLKKEQLNFKFVVNYQNEQLKINGNMLSEQCTSFVFYHQFLLFTVSTSNMYDKLFVINLILDDWIQNDTSRVKQKLGDFESKDLLNHRLVERGSRIIGISEGRVVFQLPRGNLQGIYPKIIMINEVQKKIAQKKYKLAFQIIRTHKLDFNLIYDFNPSQFYSQIEYILKDIKRIDYINLLVSQITQSVSSQLQYAVSNKDLEELEKQFSINMKGRKIKSVCRSISETLRKLDKEQFILSIFTSEIKEGRLSEVLFQIKQLKQNDVEVVIPPHLTKNGVKKEKKRLSSQQILEYVCWLVDANAIYEAALLTYDLELAAMTARCTQKDPKQYIPYLQGLKQIQDKVEFKKKICLDLKRYEIAVKQLSQGNQQQIKQSLSLIRQHKLFKHGLIIYAGKQELIKVKSLIIEQLIATGEVNQAYRVCQSIGQHQKALQFAIKSMDTKKIKQSLEIIYDKEDQRKSEVIKIINQIKDEIKNRTDLARLYAYVGEYQEAVSIYLRHNDYRKAYKYLWKVSEKFRNNDMKEGFILCFSVKRNEIVKDKKDFLEKYTRLLKVHKHKSQFGESTSFKPRQNDDMYSQVSVNSKSQSNYTISTTTGMRKKKDKKRSILSRNVKEGSILEQEYLLALIKSLEDKVEENLKDSKLLIQHLICMNLITEAEALRNEVREYITTFNTYQIKSYAKKKFEQIHPQASELYYQERKFVTLSIDSFNYLF